MKLYIFFYITRDSFNNNPVPIIAKSYKEAVSLFNSKIKNMGIDTIGIKFEPKYRVFSNGIPYTRIHTRSIDIK
jgi:hypothetical protein